PSDESDRRQLAHAVASGAKYFITRDGVLLDHADDLRVQCNIEVMRPTDFLIGLHAQSGDGYEPVRLLGTRITTSRASREADLAPFQRYRQRETSGAWYQRLRGLLVDPQRFETNIVSLDAEPLVAY